MPAGTELTAEQLKRIVEYDPETGCFRWRDTFEAGICCARMQKPYPKPGDIVRAVRKNALYQYMSIDGKWYLTHRLVWLYVYGKFPARGLHIDHINHDGFDNRLCNLRLATRSQNYFNKKTSGRNTSGYRGVSWHSQIKRWRAAVWANGKRIESSTFVDAEAAARWRDLMAKKLHGEFAVLNFPEAGGSN